MSHPFKSIVCTCCGELIRVPVYCKNRFCEVCAPARSHRVREKIKFLIKNADFSKGYFLGMITVSLSNPPSLGEGIKELQKNFSRFRRSKLWKRYIRGGVYVIEITGGPGSWHPHIHCLVEQKFLSWKTFQSRWQSLTGATAFHVKKIPAGAAERYITKYLAKPVGTPPEVAAVAKDLAHVRLFQPFGSWHGVLKSWSKLPYNCPNCGETMWLPWDLFWRDKKPGRVVERAPPGSSTSSKLEQLSQVPVSNQGVLAQVLKQEYKVRYRIYEDNWSGQ
jgi:hypothetical protein